MFAAKLQNINQWGNQSEIGYHDEQFVSSFVDGKTFRTYKNHVQKVGEY